MLRLVCLHLKWDQDDQTQTNLFQDFCVSHRSSRLQFCLHLKRDGDDRVVSNEEGKSSRERSEVGIWESEEGKPGQKSGGLQEVCPLKKAKKNPLKNETEKGFPPALCDASL